MKTINHLAKLFGEGHVKKRGCGAMLLPMPDGFIRTTIVNLNGTGNLNPVAETSIELDNYVNIIARRIGNETNT